MISESTLKSIKIILLVVCSFSSTLCLASDDTDTKVKTESKWGFKGYSGGMFYHLGYVKSQPFDVFNYNGDAIPVTVEGMTTGIGGKLGFFINKYLRTGIEGYATTSRYGEFRNAYKVGWGGWVIEFVYPTKKVMPYVGITLGGGEMKHTIFLNENNNNYHADQIVYKEDGLFIINPAIGVEYFVSQKISLIFKVDYMICGSKNKVGFATGPRAYVGIHFYRRK